MQMWIMGTAARIAPEHHSVKSHCLLITAADSVVAAAATFDVALSVPRLGANEANATSFPDVPNHDFAGGGIYSAAVSTPDRWRG